MEHIEIRRPRVEDQEPLHQFFEMVIKDTFAKEGLAEWHEDIVDEIETKKRYLKKDLESNGTYRFFLLAMIDDTIVGTIECGGASLLIEKSTKGELKNWLEVGTVFVHPDFQRRGIGNLLLNKMFTVLKENGYKEICLDSGYSIAQKIWTKKFGEPDYFFENFWGKGMHHMIWKVTL